MALRTASRSRVRSSRISTLLTRILRNPRHSLIQTEYSVLTTDHDLVFSIQSTTPARPCFQLHLIHSALSPFYGLLVYRRFLSFVHYTWSCDLFFFNLPFGLTLLLGIPRFTLGLAFLFLVSCLFVRLPVRALVRLLHVWLVV